MPASPTEPFLDSIRLRKLAKDGDRATRILESGPDLSLSFADNDYLGLSQNPKVKKAAQQAIEEHGSGARAARLLAGNFSTHRELEESLARWKSTEKSLLFSAGYLAPLGVIPSLVSGSDCILIERNAHACLFDGAKLSSAKIRIFHRKDPGDLAKALELTHKLNPMGKILIVAESLHSMDGDWLPLGEIIQLKEKYGAWLLLDEAHAGGITGPKGAGWAAELNLASRVEIQMGTLGKSLGSAGGFVAASEEMISHLVNEARTFLFGTALAPAQAGAALAALQIILSHEGGELRGKLAENIGIFRAHRPTPQTGPIQPILCADNQSALLASRRLAESGIRVPAIRPPTVPQGGVRLRISLSARHSTGDVMRLGQSLEENLPTR